MSLARYKKWIMVLILMYPLVVLTILLEKKLVDGNFGMFNLTTGDYWWDIIIIFLCIPIFSIITFFGGGYLLTPVFLFFHKKIIGRKLVYGIHEKVKSKVFKGAYVKALAPAFLAIHLGLLIADNSEIHYLIFLPYLAAGMTPAILQILTILVSFPIASAISVFLFSPTYFLLDAGIIFSTKEEDDVKNGIYPTEVNSVGGYFLDILTGYAGISVVFDFLTKTIPFMRALTYDPLLFYSNLAWPLMPFAIASMIVPIIIIQDATLKSRRNYVYKIATRLNIKGPLEDPLGIKKEENPKPN